MAASRLAGVGALDALRSRWSDAVAALVESPRVSFTAVQTQQGISPSLWSQCRSAVQARLPVPSGVHRGFHILWVRLCSELSDTDLLLLGVNLNTAAEVCNELIVSRPCNTDAVTEFRFRFGAVIPARTLKPPLIFGSFSSDALRFLSLWRRCYDLLESVDREQVLHDLPSFRFALLCVAYAPSGCAGDVRVVVIVFYHLRSMDEHDRLELIMESFESNTFIYVSCEMPLAIHQRLDLMLFDGFDAISHLLVQSNGDNIDAR